MTEQITPQMKQFLTELADLMEKHGIGMEASEDSCGYDVRASGIEVTQSGIYEGESSRPFSSIKLSTGRWEIDHKDVRSLI